LLADEIVSGNFPVVLLQAMRKLKQYANTRGVVSSATCPFLLLTRARTYGRASNCLSWGQTITTVIAGVPPIISAQQGNAGVIHYFAAGA